MYIFSYRIYNTVYIYGSSGANNLFNKQTAADLDREHKHLLQ